MSERIARLRIELEELEPKIWRRIDMPLSTTLEVLHEAIQMTMGWTFSHLWEFDIDGRCYGDPSFREFDDEPPIYKAKGLRLGVVISRGVDRFVYTYDYGDNWRHDVIVEEVRDGDPDMEYPAFVDGARRCPPEDVGGLAIVALVRKGGRSPIFSAKKSSSLLGGSKPEVPKMTAMAAFLLYHSQPRRLARLAPPPQSHWR